MKISSIEHDNEKSNRRIFLPQLLFRASGEDRRQYNDVFLRDRRIGKERLFLSPRTTVKQTQASSVKTSAGVLIPRHRLVASREFALSHAFLRNREPADFERLKIMQNPMGQLGHQPRL